MSDDALTFLSKDLGDYFTGTTTSNGNAGGTTFIDTALMAKVDDWINRECWDRITSGDANLEERKVSALDSTTGTITSLAHSVQIVSGVTYEIHRLFSASEKRIALQKAAKLAHPYIHNKVHNEAKRAGNWLKDGSLEKWTSTTALSFWTASATTLTQTSTAKLFMSGSYSCKLSGAAGYIGQSITNNDDLKYLRGKTVKLIGRGHSDTASSLRLAIHDGTTTTYSDYHPGNSAWDDESQTWYVTATIPQTATEVAFRVYHDNAAATDYVDDLRVTGPFYPKVYIADLNLPQNKPRFVGYFLYDKDQYEPIPLRNYEVDGDYLYFKSAIPTDYRLRIEGIGYLSFLKSGVESTAWDATIALEDPQMLILSAQAACWLYQGMILPNYGTGTTGDYAEGLQYWKAELADRISKYRMTLPPILTNWGL